MAEVDAKDENGLEFPLIRIRKLISASTPGAQTDLEAAAILSKVTELFLERLTHMAAASSTTMSLGVPDAKRHLLAYDDVAAAVHSWRSCDFLRDDVPQRVTGAVAKQMRAELEVSREPERLASLPAGSPMQA